MRRIYWALALPAACGLAASAAALEPIADPAAAYAGCGHYHAYGAGANAGPFYGMTPGCCQCPSSACDNAWAGYCQEKAHWKAFWYRVGTGGTGRHRSARASCQTAPAWGQPVVRPLPPVPAETAEPDEAPLPPLPKPVPEKTTWQWYNPWRR